MIVVDVILNGLMFGGLYALFGLGLSLIFGVMKISDIAHGEFAIGGAFLVIAAAIFLGAPLWLVAIALFIALHWMLHHTKAGRNIRATSDDPAMVGMMGMERAHIFAFVMGVSAALAALAGIMLAMRGSITPFSGAERLLIAFEVNVIGGLGSIWVSLPGGLALGLVHVIALRLDPSSGPLYGHLLLLAILLLRPEGLAGRKAQR